MQLRRVLLWAFVLAALVLPLTRDAGAVQRFPSPSFESDYRLPVLDQTEPKSSGAEYADTLWLFLALVLSSWLALRYRSRVGLAAVMLGALAYFGFVRNGCICPVGSLQNVALGLTDPSYAVPLFVLAAFALPLVFALFFGRIFCGAVCPLGAIQDIVVLRPIRLPRWLSEALGMLRYVYLAAALLFVWCGAGFLVCRFEPFVGFFRLSGTAAMLFFGGVTLLLGTVLARPYCRFLCPYGVLLSWMSRFSVRHLSITPDECVKCGLCADACPFDAIRKPADGAVRESREAGRRRLVTLLVLLPLIVLVAGWLGRGIGVRLSGFSPVVRLAEQIAAGVVTEKNALQAPIDAFRQTTVGIRDVAAQANVLRGRFGDGGVAAGGFLGLVFCVKLGMLSVRRKREDFEPDKAECLCCGRCFKYCPREQRRRGQQP